MRMIPISKTPAQTRAGVFYIIRIMAPHTRSRLTAVEGISRQHITLIIEHFETHSQQLARRDKYSTLSNEEFDNCQIRYRVRRLIVWSHVSSSLRNASYHSKLICLSPIPIFPPLAQFLLISPPFLISLVPLQNIIHYRPADFPRSGSLYLYAHFWRARSSSFAPPSLLHAYSPSLCCLISYMQQLVALSPSFCSVLDVG